MCARSSINGLGPHPQARCFFDFATAHQLRAEFARVRMGFRGILQFLLRQRSHG